MSEIYLYVQNKENNTDLNVWCCFPAVYNFGMSALGYLTVFKQISTIGGIFAERIFTDTQKTQIRPSCVDVMAFSFSFELDYLGILNILKTYEIPFLSKDRDESYPLISAGGPVVSANPEPFAEFFDFITIGDSENNIKQIYKILKDNKEKSKSKKLELLSKVEGVYIPTFKKDGYFVKKSSACLDCCVSTPILTEKSFFPNTFIIEVERGCPQSCAFCFLERLGHPFLFKILNV